MIDRIEFVAFIHLTLRRFNEKACRPPHDLPASHEESQGIVDMREDGFDLVGSGNVAGQVVSAGSRAAWRVEGNDNARDIGVFCLYYGQHASWKSWIKKQPRMVLGEFPIDIPGTHAGKYYQGSADDRAYKSLIYSANPEPTA